MASINFPDSPSNGDSVSLNGITYTYDSTKSIWKSTESSNVVVAITVDFAASTANSAIVLASYASNLSNSTSNLSNTTSVTATQAFTRANIGYAHANVAFNTANASFNTANIGINTANASFNTANIGINTANASFSVANNASNNYLTVALSNETTDISTGEKLRFRAAHAMTLYQLPRISLNTASSSGVVRVDIRESGTTIFTTNLTINANQTTSVTGGIPAVLSDTSIADDAIISFHVIEAGTGANGLKATLYYRRT